MAAPALLASDLGLPDLAADAADRQHLRAWLWRVLLSDGTRALTAAGRWHDALGHIHEHNGLGDRTLPGRQVAVVTGGFPDVDRMHC